MPQTEWNFLFHIREEDGRWSDIIGFRIKPVDFDLELHAGLIPQILDDDRALDGLLRRQLSVRQDHVKPDGIAFARDRRTCPRRGGRRSSHHDRRWRTRRRAIAGPVE